MPTYLVTGATGRQGGAVVDALLAQGHTVHATVRDKSSKGAVSLSKRGVILFEGTHDAPEFFSAAAANCSGVFLNLSIFVPGTAKSQTEAIISACRSAEGPLDSIVLSSAFRTAEMAANMETISAIHPFMGGYYTNKAETEQAVKASGIKNITILRLPVLDYDFLLPSSASAFAFPSLPRTGTLKTSLAEGVTLPYFDERDVARFTVAIFQKPESFAGKELEVASDNLTARRTAEILAKVSGLKVELYERTPEEVEATKMSEIFQGFELIANWRPLTIDVEGLEKRYGVKLTRVEEYLEEHKDDLLKSLPPLSLSAL